LNCIFRQSDIRLSCIGFSRCIFPCEIKFRTKIQGCQIVLSWIFFNGFFLGKIQGRQIVLYWMFTMYYGVATISRLLKIIRLFCKKPYTRDHILQKRPAILRSLFKHSHPIFLMMYYLSTTNICTK